MILAGDIGGTKTLLEIGAMQSDRWRPSFSRRYAAADHATFDSVLQTFLRDWEQHRRPGESLTHACLGVAGPTFHNRTEMTNLAWTVDGKALGAALGISHVSVVNDFFAAASGIEMLEDADLVVLQRGEALHAAPRLVIGAGTGLGVAYLAWTGTDYGVIAGEAGHACFAPATLEQIDLWRFLHTDQGPVATEQVVSGSGLARIHAYVAHTAGRSAASDAAASATLTPAAISATALGPGEPLCLRALDLFIACYGNIAGNHALAVLARGGVYIAGGIAPKILPRLEEGGFAAAFNDKGDYSKVTRKIPISVVTNARLGILGCAAIAARSWQNKAGLEDNDE